MYLLCKAAFDLLDVLIMLVLEIDVLLLNETILLQQFLILFEEGVIPVSFLLQQQFELVVFDLQGVDLAPEILHLLSTLGLDSWTKQFG